MAAAAKQKTNVAASGLADEAELVPVSVEGWQLFRGASDIWIKDLELATRADLAKPRDIRTTILKAIEEGLLSEIGAAATGANNGALFRTDTEVVTSGKGRAQAVPVYYLNREAAVHIVMRLRTPKAVELQIAVVRVFLRAMDEMRQPGTSGFAEFKPSDGPAVIVDTASGRVLGEKEELARFFSELAGVPATPKVVQIPEPTPVGPSAEAAWTMAAEALMRLEALSTELSSLKLSSGTLTAEQLLKLDDDIARLAWMRVALGYDKTIKAAKAWLQGRIAAAADWSGTGRSRRNMPSSSWPRVKVCLEQIRTDLEAEAKRRGIPKDVLERAHATSQVGLFGRAA